MIFDMYLWPFQVLTYMCALNKEYKIIFPCKYILNILVARFCGNAIAVIMLF